MPCHHVLRDMLPAAQAPSWLAGDGNCSGRYEKCCSPIWSQHAGRGAGWGEHLGHTMCYGFQCPLEPSPKP